MKKKQQSDKKKRLPPNIKLKKLVDEWSIPTFAIKIGEARVRIEQERNKIRGIEKTENTVYSYEPSPRTIRRWFSGESFPQAEYREAIFRLFPGKSSADLGFDLPEDQLALVDQEPEEHAQVSFTGQASLPRQEDEEDQLALVVDQEPEEHASANLNGQASLPWQADERDKDTSDILQEQSHVSSSTDTQKGIEPQPVRQKWYQSRWLSTQHHRSPQRSRRRFFVVAGACLVGVVGTAAAIICRPSSDSRLGDDHSPILPGATSEPSQTPGTPVHSPSSKIQPSLTKHEEVIVRTKGGEEHQLSWLGPRDCYIDEVISIETGNHIASWWYFRNGRQREPSNEDSHVHMCSGYTVEYNPPILLTRLHMVPPSSGARCIP